MRFCTAATFFRWTHKRTTSSGVRLSMMVDLRELSHLVT